jgi:CubicO group peptidase (beta-lactamase class C family)
MRSVDTFPTEKHCEPIQSASVRFDEKQIDTIFSHLDQCHHPGAAVGIALGGEPIYRKGFGLASAELPVALSPSMRMRVGSVTKQFTALTYLLLCEDRAADLDEPIGRVIPELHPVAQQVTGRQLLANISGLRDVYDLYLHFNSIGAGVSSGRLLTLYSKIGDANAPAGTEWIYNNGGYLLISTMIERLSGRSLGEFMYQRVFGPIGMNDTLLRSFDTDFVANSATPHMISRAGAFEKRSYGVDFAGAGAMVSSVDDLLRWLRHMDTPVVGNASTWRAIRTPQQLQNGSSTGYGFGQIVTTHCGILTLSHPGGWMGASAQAVKVPAAGLDIVVLVNRHDVFAGDLAQRVLEACLPEPNDSTRDVPDALSTGVFLSPATGRVVQLLIHNGRQIVAVDGFDLPYVRDVDRVLRPEPAWRWIKRSVVTVGDSTEPTSVRLNDSGTTDTLYAVPPAGRSRTPSIAGRYVSESIDTTLTIDDRDAVQTMIASGPFGSATLELTCLGQSLWRVTRTDVVKSIDGILRIPADTSDLIFSSYNTRSLPFRRCGSG